MAPAGLTVIVGEEVKTRDGDLICVFLERADPARAVGRGDDRGGSRAGRPGRHPASVRPDARVAPARRGDGAASRRSSTGSRPTTRGVVGNGNEDAAGVRARARPARRRGLGRALDHGGRRRLHRARRRPVDAGRAARRARRPLEIVPGRATLLRPALDAGRQGRQPAARQRPGPAREPLAGPPDGDGGHERRRRTGPSTDGRRSRTVR